MVVNVTVGLKRFVCVIKMEISENLCRSLPPELVRKSETSINVSSECFLHKQNVQQSNQKYTKKTAKKQNTKQNKKKQKNRSEN